MKGNHTPGPWRQGYTLMTPITRKWTHQSIEENNEHERRMVFANFTEKDQGRSRELIAQCDREEDAKLIAAAPDLLAALEECITDEGATARKSHERSMQRLKYISDLARAAIAKATQS